MKEKKKIFTTAPLPFMGQKRKFLKQFKPALMQYSETATYVDLFGGSGLLSHTIKAVYPEAKVIFNDFDNYRERLQNIDKTNHLIADIRLILHEVPDNKRIVGQYRDAILERVAFECRSGYVDFITLSTSILFSMQYVQSFEALEKQSLYNCIRQSPYSCEGYLDGLEVVSQDYKALWSTFKDDPNAVFIVDPPYLSTEVGIYKSYWKLKDFLDVLQVLDVANYFYFTSNKSQIIELCEWIETRTGYGNPFAGASIQTMNGTMTHNASYTDIMIYKYE